MVQVIRMHKIKKILKWQLALLIIALAFSNTSLAQSTDSLKLRLLHTEGEDHIKTLLRLSDRYLRVSIDTSLMYANEVLNYSRKTGNERGVARALLVLGNTYDEMGNPLKALESYKNSLEIFKNINDTAAMGYVYINLGIVYHNLGQYKNAISQYENAIEISKSRNDNYGLCLAINNIGSIYEDWKKYEPALEYYKMTLNLAKELNDSSNIGISLQNIGVVHLKKGEYKKALDFLNKSLIISQKIGDNKGIYNTLINEGNIFIALNQPGKAIENYLKALETAKQIGNEAKLAEAYLALGKAYTSMDNLPEAGKYLKEAGKIINNIEEADLKKNVYKELSEYYTKAKDFEKALDNFRKYTAMKDTIYNRESRREITEMETKYELDKKEKEIEIKNLKIEKQQTRFYFIVASILVLILLAWLLFNRYKLRQKHFQAELERKNIEIEQRLLRTQMNPHFIFNSLNSINSFITDNNTGDAQLFLSKFARLMRYILNNSRETMIPLEDEINTLQLYMELEQLRFDNKFDFDINIAEDIDTEYTFIPPMLLQPFIENSIIHGIGEKEGKGKIKVDIRKQDGVMLCTVEDDGIGRERSMQRKQGKEKKKHKSLGMQVTKERLDILNEKYGNNISFTFFDKKAGNGESTGTKVEIRIPYEEE